jgi:hypothetical protein
VDAVREELRRLGYLDRGLDRFVLARAGGTSPLRASLAAALRVGLAGAVVLGLGAAVAAAGLDPRLLAEPTDLAVLTLYLVAFLGLATALATLLGGLVTAALLRRFRRHPGPWLARNVGLGLALAGLLYLAFWWRSHLVDAPVRAQAIALVLGLALSLALGRFGALAAVAVLSAGGVSQTLPRARLSGRHLLPLLAAATLVYGAGIAAAAYFERRVPDAPDYAVVPTGLRVRVLGIDGLERRMTEQMLGRGEMPRLQALLASGANGRLRAEPERVPAIVWTTIATGRGPDAHGIQATGTRRITGMRTPLALESDESPFASALGAATDLLRLTRRAPPTSVLRSAKAFWNVASEKGLRVGIVNWWATWPADAVNGYLVSDRAFFKIEKGGPADREVYPESVFARLRELAPDPEDRPRRLDRFQVAAARALRGAERPDIEAVYLPGLDILTMQRLGEAPGSDVASLDAQLGEVRDHYRFADGLIGEEAEGRGPSDVLVIVGDPGRLARGGPQLPEGTILIAGGPVRPVDLGLVSSRDVAPTVLHLAGLPISRELDGTVLEAALEPAFLAAHPVRMVPRYGQRKPAPPTESAFDREMLEELRSLGYIR